MWWEAKFLLNGWDAEARGGQITCLVTPLHREKAAKQTVYHSAGAMKQFRDGHGWWVTITEEDNTSILVSIVGDSVLHSRDGRSEEHGASYMWPSRLDIFSGNGILRATIKYAELKTHQKRPIYHFRYSLLTIQKLKSFKALRQRNNLIY